MIARVMMIWACVMLAACADDPNQIVDDKLAAITEQPIVATNEGLPEVVAMPRGYQDFGDPFYDANRTVASHQPNDKPAKANAQTMNTDDKPSDPSANKNSLADVPALTKQTQPMSLPKPPPPNLPQAMVDNDRVRQPLERYDLSSLRYQGNIFDETRQVALISSPDGLIHQLTVGQYIGKNHGQVVRIDARTIVINEAMMAADGRYYSHQTTMAFVGK